MTRPTQIRVNIATGNESFEAWREGIHDDLVLAVAMAVRFGENPPRPFTEENGALSAHLSDSFHGGGVIYPH